MALAKFISRTVTSITKETFKFNKTIDILISQFEGSCPTTEELVVLIGQKNYINGALEAIQKKIENLNKVAQTSLTLVEALAIATTFIKQLPLPTSFPPGVGIPLSIINTFSDTLDNLGDIIKKEKGSLDSIPVALEAIKSDIGEVITKLNDLGVSLDVCLNADPDITQAIIDTIVPTTGNFDGVLSATDLNNMLTSNSSPGLLYKGYYLRLTSVPTDGFSFDKKQIVAQNKESVPLPGEYYNLLVPEEILLGDESFSSSNIVLVNEMKWLIDTKDLIFPPPPPAEDPLKALYKLSQLLILQSIYGADQEESEELYERAWEYSNNRGPNAVNYQQLQEEAFSNSRTLLEQAVANEGFEFKDGDRILSATIKKLFFSKITTKIQQDALTSQLKSEARTLFNYVEDIGGVYNQKTKTWEEEEDFYFAINPLAANYAARLRNTARSDDYNGELAQKYGAVIEEEIFTRKPKYQAIYEVANRLFLDTRGIPGLSDIEFNDPLQSFFLDLDLGYNQVSLFNSIIEPDGNRVISPTQLEDFYDFEQSATSLLYATSNPKFDQSTDSSVVLMTTEFGLTENNQKSYSKNRLLIKMLGLFGLAWYNENIREISALPFWSKTPNPNNTTDPEAVQFNYLNDPNFQTPSPSNNGVIGQGFTNGLVPETDEWFFAFGKNDLPLPPSNPIIFPEPGWWW